MFKTGRLPRKFGPVPHMSALLCGAAMPIAVPAQRDWTGEIKSFGYMLNDRLGDCTCAGIYHAKQIWTLNTGKEQTESDACVEKLYESACGYIPGNPQTDRGGCLQDVLNHCMNVGFPLNDGTMEKFLGFIEVDPRNQNDIQVAINEFGLAYIGFNIPNTLWEPNGNPKAVWAMENPQAQLEGGHCVILVGYNAQGPIVLSWGGIYQMTWQFLQFYVDEIYAIVSKDWLENNNQTPLGMTVPQLEALMQQIKGHQ